MRTYILLLMALFCANASYARAEWIANVKGPDVFGNITVSVLTSSENDGFVIQCDQQDQLVLAFLIPVPDSQSSVEPTPAELLVQADSAAPKKMSANLGGWNAHFAAVSVSGRNSDLVDVVRMIGSARNKINVGVVIEGHRFSDSFGSSGSTSAIKTAVTDCKLDNVSNKGTDSPEKP